MTQINIAREKLLAFIKPIKFKFNHDINEYQGETIKYNFECENGHVSYVSSKALRKRVKKCPDCIKLKNVNKDNTKEEKNKKEQFKEIKKIYENSEYEHVCRQVFIFLLNHIDTNKIESFELNQYEDREYYTIGELKYITNYDNIKYYAPVKRPRFLRIENLNSKISTGINLEIDCYNEELNIGLEVDSNSHFKYSSRGSIQEDIKFKRQQELDTIKNNLCKENNTLLFRISYKTYENGLDSIKKYMYNEFKINNINLSITYEEFILDNYILDNMINNNFGNIKSYRVTNIIYKCVLNNLNYSFSKSILGLLKIDDKFNIICNKHDKFETCFRNFIGSRERSNLRNCPKCAPNRSLNNKIINDIINEYNISMIGEYNGKSGDNQLFECNTIFKHQFYMSWDNMKQRYELGCIKCRSLIDNVKIYKYDKEHNYISSYKNIKELQNSEQFTIDQLCLVRKNLMKEKYHNSIYNNIYSILAPVDDKLIENKEYTSYEIVIIYILNISFEKRKYQQLTSNEDDKRKNKPVYMLSLDNKFIHKYLNAQMAADDKNIDKSTILRACRKEDNKYAGYRWKLLSEMSEEDIEYYLDNTTEDIDNNFEKRKFTSTDLDNKIIVKLTADYIYLDEWSYSDFKLYMKQNNLKWDTVRDCITNRRSSGYNFIWRYKDEIEDKIELYKSNVHKKILRSDGKIYDNINNVLEDLTNENIKRINLVYIIDCCNGDKKNANGYAWKYV